MNPIGSIETVFAEKFGVPRQSLMVESAQGKIKLLPEFSHPDVVLHLQEFSHLWVVYLFHKNQQKWSPTIQPPRIDAPSRIGVFASRSPHRPNPIGLSVVKIEKINTQCPDGIEIEVSGVDILNGSPVLDLKPYVPYADMITNATSGWIKNEIVRYPVEFTEAALKVLEREELTENTTAPNLIKLITEILEWDPRPRSQRESTPPEFKVSHGKKFAFRLLHLDIHWVIENEIEPCFKVVEVKII